jgi:hypothetical protein
VKKRGEPRHCHSPFPRLCRFRSSLPCPPIFVAAGHINGQLSLDSISQANLSVLCSSWLLRSSFLLVVCGVCLALAEWELPWGAPWSTCRVCWEGAEAMATARWRGGSSCRRWSSRSGWTARDASSKSGAHSPPWKVLSLFLSAAVVGVFFFFFALRAQKISKSDFRFRVTLGPWNVRK